MSRSLQVQPFKRSVILLITDDGIIPINADGNYSLNETLAPYIDMDLSNQILRIGDSATSNDGKNKHYIFGDLRGHYPSTRNSHHYHQRRRRSPYTSGIRQNRRRYHSADEWPRYGSMSCHYKREPKPFHWYYERKPHSRYTEIIHEDSVIFSKNHKGWVSLKDYYCNNSHHLTQQAIFDKHSSQSMNKPDHSIHWPIIPYVDDQTELYEPSSDVQQTNNFSNSIKSPNQRFNHKMPVPYSSDKTEIYESSTQ